MRSCRKQDSSAATPAQRNRRVRGGCGIQKVTERGFLVRNTFTLFYWLNVV
jgi:hypothetical protein